MKDFKQQVLQVLEKSSDVSYATKFQSLIKFVDNSLASAYGLEGNERAQFLVKSLLNIRDFLMSDISENSVRLSILKQVSEIREEIERKEEIERSGFAKTDEDSSSEKFKKKLFEQETELD